MKRINYPDDCKTIQNVALSLGWEISLSEAQDLWQKVSDDYCASWLVMPKQNEEIIKMIIDLFPKF